MIFPSSTSITSQSPTFSKTASSAATSKPSAPSSSSWFFSHDGDGDDVSGSSIGSETVTVQAVASPKSTINAAPAASVKKQDPTLPSSKQDGPVFSVWSIFANGDEQPDPPLPLKEKVAVVDVTHQEPESVFLLENGIEEKVRNVYGSLFVQEEDDEGHQDKVTVVEKEDVVVDTPSSPSAPLSFASSFLDGFFVEEQDDDKIDTSRLEDQEQDVVYTWFPSFFAGEEKEEKVVRVQDKVIDAAPRVEKEEASPSSLSFPTHPYSFFK